MATKTKVKGTITKTTKSKITDSVKNVFINELKDSKEEERLERVKANGNLKEVIIFTSSTCPYCKQMKDALDQEGVKYVEKEASQKEHSAEWQTVSGITGLPVFPTLEIEGNYIVPRRDFQQIPQGVQMIVALANPDLIKPSDELRMIEGLKTLNYHMSTAFQQMNGQLQPLTTFITSIEKQIKEEEEKENTLPSEEKGE